MARDAARRDRVRIGLSPQSKRQEAESSSQEERRPREGVDDGADFVATRSTGGRLRFQPSRLHPADPIKCGTSTQRTQAPESVDIRKSLLPWPTRERYRPTI